MNFIDSLYPNAPIWLDMFLFQYSLISDETVANIIGYDEKPELVEVDPHFSLDFLPPLEDLDLSSFDWNVQKNI